MTGSLPRAAPWATGMTKCVCARREYSKRWRDRVQRRGAGDGQRHEWRSKAGTGAVGRVWGEPPKPRPAGPLRHAERCGRAFSDTKNLSPPCPHALRFLVAVEPRIFCGVIPFRVSGFRPRKRHLREGCGLARSWRVGARMRERGPPRLTGAADTIDALSDSKFGVVRAWRVAAGQDGGRAGWGVYPRAKTAPRRPGGHAHARRCGRRSAVGGGCHTGDVETAACAQERKELATRRAGALADETPLRQAKRRRPYRSG